PAAWVYGGLDAGAWHYMNRTSAEGYSTVANAEFERFIDGLGALDVHPMAVRPHDPYGVTGTELMHGHLEG
ncbi:MAG: hypothetical protein GVY12_00645, partial [Bacteroidetes bacterium]|nr:hypothetical protein [Bacteroidota bacterium]